MDFPCRSWLCIPATIEHLDRKIISSNADIVIVDLEDSIPPEAKPLARECIRGVNLWQASRPVAIRINSLESEDGLRDLLHLLEHAICPDIIIMSKVADPAEIRIVEKVLSRWRALPKIFALVETMRGLRSADTLATAGGALAGFIFGSADLAADVPCSLESRFLDHSKYDVAAAAIKGGLIAIDAPCFNMSEPDIMKCEIKSAKDYGYRGKMAIHPKQVDSINHAFTLSKEEIESATLVLSAANGEGRSVGMMSSGDMVGPPFRRRAQALLNGYRVESKA